MVEHFRGLVEDYLNTLWSLGRENTIDCEYGYPV
jgi:hypothetical protein